MTFYSSVLLIYYHWIIFSFNFFFCDFVCVKLLFVNKSVWKNKRKILVYEQPVKSWSSQEGKMNLVAEMEKEEEWMLWDRRRMWWEAWENDINKRDKQKNWIFQRSCVSDTSTILSPSRLETTHYHSHKTYFCEGMHLELMISMGINASTHSETRCA